MKNVCMVEQNHTGTTYDIQALDLLWLEGKCRSRGMGHTGGSTANSNFSADSNLYSKRL
jgi:hypothetical protein